MTFTRLRTWLSLSRSSKRRTPKPACREGPWFEDRIIRRIAKADADIIYLTGYEGGTGAARQHSLKYVGLPAEIGVVEAHRALTEAGLRGRVEIWCDGGMRTAADVVKMICLGANRVGFGTLAMVAIGCTICRDCQSGNCHTGITQIASVEQAQNRAAPFCAS
jgi:glutamate synthase (NADPH/NADH) large chain